MKAPWSVMLLALTFGLACSGGDDEDPTPTATPSPATTATAAEASPTPAQVRATPFPTWPPVEAAPSTVWLIDVVTGRVITLYESFDVAAAAAWFDEDGPVVLASVGSVVPELIEFGIVGTEVGRERWGVWGPCLEHDTGVEVGGRLYAGVDCGPLSPDGRWMVYWVEAGEIEVRPGALLPVQDLWAVDLQTDERTLVAEELLVCQGDGFFFPGWSPDGKHVHFGDCRDGGRIFLRDVASGTTRQLATGILPDFSTEPAWSPHGDVLLYPDGSGGVVFEDLQAGTREELPGVRWPVRFEPSGAYFFTQPNPDEPAVTSIYDARTRNAVAMLAGMPVYQLPLGNIMLRFVPVSAINGGFVAALVEAQGCDGTVLYRNQTLVECVEKSYGPTISPDGSQVVLSRLSGVSGPVEGPGFGSVSMNIYDIVLVDLETGAETLLARGALGGNQYPTPAVWSDAGSHILVKMPFGYGP